MVAVEELRGRPERRCGGDDGVDKTDAAISVERTAFPGFRIHSGDKHCFLGQSVKGSWLVTIFRLSDAVPVAEVRAHAP